MKIHDFVRDTRQMWMLRPEPPAYAKVHPEMAKAFLREMMALRMYVPWSDKATLGTLAGVNIREDWNMPRNSVAFFGPDDKLWHVIDHDAEQFEEWVKSDADQTLDEFVESLSRA